MDRVGVYYYQKMDGGCMIERRRGVMCTVRYNLMEWEMRDEG